MTECAICLNDLKGVCITLCSHPAHLVHDQCAKNLIEQGGDKCPLCRTRIEPSVLHAKDDNLQAKELHVVTDEKSIFVSLCKNLERKDMPSVEAFRKPEVFMKHGLKEIRFEFRAEGKAQQKQILRIGSLTIQLIAKHLQTWILDQFKTEYDLAEWFGYNEDENVKRIHKGNTPAFCAEIQGTSSIILFNLQRTCKSKHAMVGEPFYSKKDALNMWDYETFYCWYLQIAFMDSKEKKKKSFAERLRALPMFVLP